MTFEQLISLTNGLLTGDIQLPSDNKEVFMLYKMAIMNISKMADALRLYTDDPTARITRVGISGAFIRKPKDPEHFDDEIDLDEDLCFAVGHYMASLVSKRNSDRFLNEARKIVNLYNQEVEAFISNAESDAWNNQNVGMDTFKYGSGEPNTRTNGDYLNVYNRGGN